MIISNYVRLFFFAFFAFLFIFFAFRFIADSWPIALEPMCCRWRTKKKKGTTMPWLGSLANEQSSASNFVVKVYILATFAIIL